MERELSKAQERNLLRKHLSGDFSEHRWESIKVLFDKGYIKSVGKTITVTAKGAEYCEEYHGDIGL